MSAMRHDRKLAAPEIEVLLHLLRYGDGRTPITLLRATRANTMALWRLGLIDIWYRQSRSSRLEGPFYTLTWNGRERATALFLARQSRAALSPKPQAAPLFDGVAPPPAT